VALIEKGERAMSIFFANTKIDRSVSRVEIEERGFTMPMGQVGRQQFTMSLVVLALAAAGFILFNLFHFIVA
jgi:hypothetical protein